MFRHVLKETDNYIEDVQFINRKRELGSTGFKRVGKIDLATIFKRRFVPLNI